MASFIKVGHCYINIDHIVKVYPHDNKVAVDYGTKTEFYPETECTHLLDFVNNFSL